jgi:hypothetical protein
MAHGGKHDYPKDCTNDETPRYGPDSGTGSPNFLSSATQDVSRSEAGSLEDVGQNVDGHGPEPKHETCLLNKEQLIPQRRR